ncbi:immediate early response 3-interacting protein 1 isoform X2 [Halyomorpha halys]|uniref:immediate early response 3-interacting protein 1 isoform X2 n=1 Tax=Halyomorpha halys TaxID=286706 RepID=UPI0006D4E90D|nr:immediate early response 3-interacting protein 1 [Halyomorpha halys]
MAVTLWGLLEASILFLNAVCVLHEERFLAKMGWWRAPSIQGFGEKPTFKMQCLHLMHSIRTVTRIPLIFINILVILIKLILG